MGDKQLMKAASLFNKQKISFVINRLLEISLYLVPIFLIFKWSYATSVCVWIFGFYLLSILFEKRKPGFSSPVRWAVVVFMFSVIIPSLMTIGVVDTWREGKHFLYGIGLFFVLMDQIQQKENILRRYLWIMLALSVFVSLDTLWQFYTGTDLLGNVADEGRLPGVFSNPNYLGFFLSGIVPIHTYFLETRKLISEKIFFSIFLLMSLIAIALSGCRSAWGGIFLFYFFLLFYHSNKKVRLVYLVLPLFFVTPILYFMDQKWMASRFIHVFFVDDDRPTIWLNTIRMIREHPFVGQGLDSYKDLSPSVFYMGTNWKYSGPHNFFLEVWQTSGIVAFFAFLYFLYKIIVVNIRYIKVRGEYVFLFPSAVLVFLSSVVSIPFFSKHTSLYLWLYFGLLSGAMQIRNSKDMAKE